jgi:hypothetical protein
LAASARVETETNRRRPFSHLTLSIVVVFLIAAAGTAWLAHERSVRMAEAERLRASAAAPKPGPAPSVRLERIWQFRGHGGPISGFRTLKSGLIASWSEDKTLRIWSSVDGSLRVSLPHEEAVGSVRFSPDEKLVISANQAHHVSYLWDLTARIAERPAIQVQHADGIVPLSGWEMIAWKTAGGAIRLWHSDRHETELEQSQDASPANLSSTSVGSQDYVFLSSPGSVWNASTGKLLQRIRDTTNYEFNYEVGRFQLVLPPPQDQTPTYGGRYRLGSGNPTAEARGGAVVVVAVTFRQACVTAASPSC